MSSDGDVPRRIVVGVDGSVASVQALRWALGYARAAGAAVEAVIAWDIPSSMGYGPTVIEGVDIATAAREALAAIVEGNSAEYPGVAVTQRALRGHPADVLIDEAEGADLLVVGSHGYGGFARALLGSVSQHCISHADCPVVVVRGNR
ncbi:universal stress protein [Luedemannella helvata]|uniref:Universal stress protein n=1 Tax=Luedemannella helvata TaxID=349315 RepID=A0ABP4WXK6_9ACTN